MQGTRKKSFKHYKHRNLDTKCTLSNYVALKVLNLFCKYPYYF